MTPFLITAFYRAKLKYWTPFHQVVICPNLVIKPKPKHELITWILHTDNLERSPKSSYRSRSGALIFTMDFRYLKPKAETRWKYPCKKKLTSNIRQFFGAGSMQNLQPALRQFGSVQRHKFSAWRPDGLLTPDSKCFCLLPEGTGNMCCRAAELPIRSRESPLHCWS